MERVYYNNAPGWANIGVVPLPATVDNPNPKHPLPANWNHATLEMVEGFRSQYPTAQIGILTGTNGIIILDLDVKRPPANGIQTLEKWQIIYGKLPDTLTWRTPSGGLQMAYIADRDGLAHASPIKNGEGIGTGVDVQAEGKFTMVPPSVMPDGTRYEYINPECVIARANQNVYDFIAYIKQVDGTQGNTLQAVISDTDAAILELENRDTLSALEAIPCKDIARIDWIHIGCALKNIGASVDVWDRWSSLDTDRYHVGECERLWSGLNGNWNGGTIIAMAKKYGYKPEQVTSQIKLVSVDAVTEKSAEWLIPGRVPKGQMTMIVGDGGVGKTTITSAIIAAVSTGKPTFLEGPFAISQRDSGRVVYFSAEDSTEYVLKKKLRENGANMRNIYTLQPESDQFSEIKFGSPTLEKIINDYRPSLVVFDPIQQFIPETVKMSERNAMRQCLAPLMVYGKKYGTTFIIIVHTNKRAGASGRNRMADSADVWDISRSVLIAGETKQKGVRYLSHEKSNYGMRELTVLYSIEGQTIQYRGTTEKRDADFVAEQEVRRRAAPEREEAKKFIIDYLLREGRTAINEILESAESAGISKATFRNAKDELIAGGQVERSYAGRNGKGKGVEWALSLKT